MENNVKRRFLADVGKSDKMKDLGEWCFFVLSNRLLLFIDLFRCFMYISVKFENISFAFHDFSIIGISICLGDQTQ